jgi:polar amino acid transport system substrate-binding protein
MPLPAVQPTDATAAPPDAAATDPTVLRVGVFDLPPFSEPLGDGRWGGEGVRLFEDLGSRLGVSVEYRAADEATILRDLADGTLDACASPIVPSSDLLGSLDFSHPIATVGLGVAVRDAEGVLDSLGTVLQSLLGTPQRHLVVVIGIFVLIAACAVWLAERHRNPHFDRGATKGIGASLWWSVVTLATVGYGDKVPRTVVGRLLAAAWMLVSLVLITVLTATIVSAITVGSLATRTIHSASDLRGIRVAAPRGSEAADWLAANDVPSIGAGSVEDAVALLRDGAVNAVVAPQDELAIAIRDDREFTLSSARLRDDYACFAFRRGLGEDFMRRVDAALLDARGATARGDGTVRALPRDAAQKDER